MINTAFFSVYIGMFWKKTFNYSSSENSFSIQVKNKNRDTFVWLSTDPKIDI